MWKNKDSFFRVSVVIAILAFSIYPVSGFDIQTSLTHYSVANGLSENHILCSLQDSRGYLWFGTNDGLNRFDGYSFKWFKGKTSDKYKLLNFRINRIVEDKKGHLWITTDDNRFYRFNPATESFLPVPQFQDDLKGYSKALNRITITPDGTVWLSSNKDTNQDIFQITDTSSLIVKKIAIRSNHAKIITNKIYQDKNYNLWFLTSNGLVMMRKNNKEIRTLQNIYDGNFICEYENKQFIYFGADKGNIIIYDKTMQLFSIIKLPTALTTTDILQLSENELFISTKSTQFFIYNLQEKTFKTYTIKGSNNLIIRDIFADKDEKIWIDTEEPGVQYFDIKTKQLHNLNIEPTEYIYPNKPRFLIFEDNLKNKWFLTFEGGFYKYNKYTNKLEPLIINEDKKISISNMVHHVLADQQGNLWINQYSQGIDKVVFTESLFTFNKVEPTSGYNSKNEVRSIFEDSKQQLWLGSKKGYVYIYDEKRNFKGYFGANGNLNSEIPFNSPVYCITEDYAGNIWLGTKGTGLYHLKRKANGNYFITNFRNDEHNHNSINSNQIYSVFEDNKKRIWVGTFEGGLNLIDSINGEISFIHKNNELSQYPTNKYQKIRHITQDNKGRLLISTTEGLLVSNPLNDSYKKIRFSIFQYDPKKEFSITGNDVYFIHQASNNDIYISTIGGGVSVIKGGFQENLEPKFEILKSIDETIISSVYTILSDKQQNLWMTAQNKIFCFNPKSRKLDVYDPGNNEIYFIDEASVCNTFEGKILIGTSNGYISFNPSTIKKSEYIPKIVLTEFKLFNKTILVGEESSPLKKAIDYTKELILKHNQSTISFEFAALDYRKPEQIQYAYNMEGLDENWNYSGTQRQATYINLPKGKYVFKVKSTNSDGLWVDNEKSIVIIKKPSFWESIWGLIFYLLIFISLSLTVVYVLFTIFRLRNEVNVEHRISGIKLRFFTDISHELRTPLTLISAPVENILKKENLTSSAKTQLQIVQKNTERMLRLINQILDFRKIQNNKMKLVLEQVNIVFLVNDICSSFFKFAEEKNIELSVISILSEDIRIWIDKDKFEKIIFNLLSNAIKFSTRGKKIEVKISELDNDIQINIKDYGIGISKDRFKYLFDRFETIANSSSAFQASTGIGLSLTKELIELHKATIELDSDVNNGTEFRLYFKKGVEVYKNQSDITMMDSIKIDEGSQNEQVNFDEDTIMEIPESETRCDDLKKILIVEDNFELRNFLKSFLISNYEIIEAESGTKALDIAKHNLPDLIISDILMPDMNGLEFAKKVKEDISLSHIPFIVLTAKTDIETKLNALESGVDDYITKPFSSNYLEARIENLLRLRSQLQSYFRSSLTSGVISLSKPELSDFDEVFIKKTMFYIEENYLNSEMAIEDIAISLGMSRSTFFKKLKSLTGIAPVDFVREFRIQRAAQLLDAGESNISQISYSVGINDPRYFTKCFKLKYNVNPSEYKNRLHKKL